MKWSNQKICHVELTDVPCMRFVVTNVPLTADTYWGLGTANIKVARDNKVSGVIEATVTDILPFFKKDPTDCTRGYILIPTAIIEAIQKELGYNFQTVNNYDNIKKMLWKKYGPKS